MINDEKKQKAKDDFITAQRLEKNGESFSASFYYENALKTYRDLGDSKNQQICKSNLREANKKAVDEFKKIEIEQEIPKEKLEKDMEHLNKMMNGELSDVLKKIAFSQLFFPKFKDTVITANNNMPLVATLATTSTFDERGNIIKGSDDGQFTWIMQIYGLHQNLIVEFYLKKIINELILMGKLNEADFFAFLEKCEFIPDDDFRIIKMGFHFFFNEDYGVIRKSWF